MVGGEESETTKGLVKFVDVDWDIVTMKTMPRHIVVKMIRLGVDFTGEWVPEDRLELVPDRPQVGDRDELIAAMNLEYEWVNDFEQMARTMEVEGGSFEDVVIVSHWHHHLTKTLKFPIEVIYLGDTRTGLPHASEVLITRVLPEVDPDRGVMGEAAYEGKTFDIPLSEVDLLDDDEENQPLLDYIVRYPEIYED